MRDPNSGRLKDRRHPGAKGVRCGQDARRRLAQRLATHGRLCRQDRRIWQESVDRLCQRAGELGLKNVPVFVFQEGFEPEAERAFKEIARLSRGAWCRFDAGSAHELTTLLRAVAVYASGGSDALRRLAGREQGLVRQLARQLD